MPSSAARATRATVAPPCRRVAGQPLSAVVDGGGSSTHSGSSQGLGTCASGWPKAVSDNISLPTRLASCRTRLTAGLPAGTRSPWGEHEPQRSEGRHRWRPPPVRGRGRALRLKKHLQTTRPGRLHSTPQATWRRKTTLTQPGGTQPTGQDGQTCQFLGGVLAHGWVTAGACVCWSPRGCARASYTHRGLTLVKFGGMACCWLWPGGVCSVWLWLGLLLTRVRVVCGCVCNGCGC